MKYNTQTKEIEGTPQEIKEFLQKKDDTSIKEYVYQERKELPMITMQPKTEINKISRAHWTTKEMRALKKNRTQEISVLQKIFPHRTGSAIIHKMYDMKLITKLKYPKNNGVKIVFPFHKNVTGKVNANVKRFQFMNIRARYYMDKFNWTREKAYTQANADYVTNKKTPIDLQQPPIPPTLLNKYKLCVSERGSGLRTIDVYDTYDEAHEKEKALMIEDTLRNEKDKEYIVLRI